MNPLISEFKAFTQTIILQLKEELKSLRTGRANTALVEDLIVETYGGSTKLKLKELSTITTDGPTALLILPFDQSTSADIEKAILKSPLGLSPQVQGGKIIIRLPPLSEEQRQKMVKIANQKIEDHKVMIRHERDEVRKKIKQQFDAKTLGEDEKFRLEKEVETITQNSSAEMQTVKENKEQEIMEV